MKGAQLFATSVDTAVPTEIQVPVTAVYRCYLLP